MFIRNQWYIAAAPDEVGREPLGRWICGEPLVFFRRRDGVAVALEDRCPHRKYALSKGAVIGDDIQCFYHGLRFGGDGACTRIPGESKIPKSLCARAYPLVERQGWVWVWMGDADKADEALLPDFSRNDAPGWKAVRGYNHINGHYQLFLDNAMDLTHLSFVHANSIGNAQVAEMPLETWTEGDIVRAQRRIPDGDSPPLFTKARGFTGKIDRTQDITFEPPCHVHNEVTAVAAGTNDLENGLHWEVLNSFTPETERSTHYFWTVARAFAVDDDDISAMLAQGIHDTFEEDIVVIEEQQILIDSDRSGTPLRSIPADAAGLAVRRVIDRLLRAEGGAPSPAAGTLGRGDR